MVLFSKEFLKKVDGFDFYLRMLIVTLLSFVYFIVLYVSYSHYLTYGDISIMALVLFFHILWIISYIYSRYRAKVLKNVK